MTHQLQTQFKWPLRIYYEDTDAGGVVYHANYLNFMERARTEWLRALGFEQTELRQTLGIIIVVHSISLAFKRPAYFNDLLLIECKVVKIGHTSIALEQTIMKKEITLVEAAVKVAFVDANTFKPVGIPAVIKVAMEKI